MKVWQIIGMVEADGWEMRYMKGSHRQYKHPSKPGKVTIPGKRSDDLHPSIAIQHPSPGRPTTMTRDFRKQADNYLILVAGGPPTNYSAWSPDVLGCVATGDTIEECVAHMKEALAFHLEFLNEDGDPIPEPTGPGVYIARDPVPAA